MTEDPPDELWSIEEVRRYIGAKTTRNAQSVLAYHGVKLVTREMGSGHVGAPRGLYNAKEVREATKTYRPAADRRDALAARIRTEARTSGSLSEIARTLGCTFQRVGRVLTMMADGPQIREQIERNRLARREQHTRVTRQEERA